MADVEIIGTMKRGETFAVDIALTDKDGDPVTLNLTASPPIVSAEIRRKNGALLATGTVSATSTAGTYKVSYAGSTAAWPLEAIYTDIRAVIDGSVVKSKPSTGVNVIRDETRG